MLQFAAPTPWAVSWLYAGLCLSSPSWLQLFSLRSVLLVPLIHTRCTMTLHSPPLPCCPRARGELGIGAAACRDLGKQPWKSCCADAGVLLSAFSESVGLQQHLATWLLCSSGNIAEWNSTIAGREHFNEIPLSLFPVKIKTQNFKNILSYLLSNLLICSLIFLILKKKGECGLFFSFKGN